MLELENRHLAIITVMINSGKNHKWMLKVGKSCRSNKIHSLRISPHKILMYYKRKKHFCNKRYQRHLSPDKMHRKQSITSGRFLPKTHTSNLIMMKHKRSSNFGTFYKITNQFSKLKGCKKQRLRYQPNT